MARLNEPPVPAESLEAVKRRFLRQNRELARINSNQSIRLHNLEAEKAQLIAENFTLREEAAQLRIELENNTNSDRHVQCSVSVLKERLEAQIQELTGLASELDILQRPAVRRRGLSTSPIDKIPVSERIKHTAVPVKVETEDDGRLPTIVEDKFYPRRTMDSGEIRELLQSSQSTESPDPGPPPVAHFDDVESEDLSGQQDGAGDEGRQWTLGTDPLGPDLTVNLETRRRRKDIRRVSVFLSPPESSDRPDISDPVKGLPIRTSAKRKYSARVEEDERSNSESTMSGETSRLTSNHTTSMPQLGWADISNSEENETQSMIGSERRVLGEKSVNTDPVVSPKKSKVPSSSKDAAIKPSQGSREPSRHREPSRKQKPPPKPTNPEVHPIADSAPVANDPSSELSKLAPTTPAPPPDLLSPTSTELSARALPPKDTPPPVAINLNPGGSSHGSLSAEHNAIDTGRTARRARAPVNYAEPSLNRKMRRPTSALVDAVSREERKSYSSDLAAPGSVQGVRAATTPAPSAESAAASTGGEKPKLRTVVIKREEGSGRGNSWKTTVPAAPLPDFQRGDLPGHTDDAKDHRAYDHDQEQPSPLGKKSIAAAGRGGRKTRAPEDSQHQDNDTADIEEPDADDHRPAGPSASATAIAALMSGAAASRRKKTAPSAQDPSEVTSAEPSSTTNEPATRRASLSVYDFSASSPPEEDGNSATVGASSTRPKKGGKRVRNSVSGAVGLGRTAVGSSGAGGEDSNARVKDLKGARSVTALAASGSGPSGEASEVDAQKDPAAEALQRRRAAGERLASRRKSMML